MCLFFFRCKWRANTWYDLHAVWWTECMCSIILVIVPPWVSWLALICFLYVLAEPRPRKYKCGLSAPCPPKHLAFRLVSGAANVIGPKICLEDKMWELMLRSLVDTCVSPLLSHVFYYVFFRGVTLCSFLSSLLSFPHLSGELNASIFHSVCLSFFFKFCP